MADNYYVCDGKSITSKKGIQDEGADVTAILDDRQKERLVKLKAISTAKPDCLKRKEEAEKAAKDKPAASKPAASDKADK